MKDSPLAVVHPIARSLQAIPWPGLPSLSSPSLEPFVFGEVKFVALQVCSRFAGLLRVSLVTPLLLFPKSLQVIPLPNHQVVLELVRQTAQGGPTVPVLISDFDYYSEHDVCVLASAPMDVLGYCRSYVELE